MIHLQIILQGEVIELLCKHGCCGNTLFVLEVVAGADAIFEFLSKKCRLEGAFADFFEHALCLLLFLE